MRAWIVAGWLVVAVAVATGAEPKPRPGRGRDPQGPVDIRSDALTVRQKENRAVFSGNVRCVQGDLIILCDRLVVTYAGEKDPDDKAGSIRRMLFTGSVSIRQGERKGHCQQAEYDRPGHRVVCTGDPWVVEGENRIRGDRIVYLLDRDEVRVTRPRAVIRLPAPEAGSEGGAR